MTEKSITLHGVLAYEGYNFDENGHSDEYDLLFTPDDSSQEIIELPWEVAPPMSVHDRAVGTLTITFRSESTIDPAEWMQITTDSENQPHQFEDT